MSVDGALLDNIQAVLDQEPLLSVADMLDVFSTKRPVRKHLHIIVQVPPAGQLSANVATLSSVLIAV